MKTYWVRLITDNYMTCKHLDMWTTGFDADGEKTSRCFAIRARDENDVYDLLAELFTEYSYEVDFIEKKDWQKYGDFAGRKSRFPLDDMHLDDQIDSVLDVRGRLA